MVGFKVCGKPVYSIAKIGSIRLSVVDTVDFAFYVWFTFGGGTSKIGQVYTCVRGLRVPV